MDFLFTPWEASQQGDYGDYDGKCRVICDDDKRIIVVLGEGEETDAITSVVTAAPDMLLLLEAWSPILEKQFAAMPVNLRNHDYHVMKERIERTRFVIAKARRTLKPGQVIP